MSLNFIIIYLIILAPFVGSSIILFLPSSWHKLIKQFAIIFSLLSFIPTLFLWGNYIKNIGNIIFLKSLASLTNFPFDFIIGLDGISLSLITLTNLLMPLCILASWDYIKHSRKLYYICFLIIQSLLIIIFLTLDILTFYIFFESILIPMFLIVGIWGSRERKIRAAYMLFLYTLFGSLFMLAAISYIYMKLGTTNYFLLLTSTYDNSMIENFLWFAFFLAFATKVPMMPVHIWLPEAHVEAPTAGSVLLAGVLLKLGTYGFLRFTIPLFPLATYTFTPFIYIISLIAIIYTSLTATRQTDLKRIIAYASVAHMNLIIIGLFTLTVQGIEGGILQMLSHGIVSSALFLLIGVIYDRHHSRIISYYSGLASIMPLYAFCFILFTMANIALPGTSSFIGEFLIFIGIFKVNTTVIFFSALSMVLGGGYSLWLSNRLLFGNLKNKHASSFYDLNFREFSILLPLCFLTLYMGIYPEAWLKSLHLSTYNLIYLTLI